LAPFALTVIVTGASVATFAEVTVKVPVVAPAGTETVAGTVAAEVLLDEAVRLNPPAGAALLRVIVPVELAMPPVTLVGAKLKPVTVGAETARLAVALLEPVVPVIVTVALEATGAVVAVNVPVVAPAAIVIEAGTVTAALFEDNVTVRVSPVATGPFNVTVPVDELPPTTDVGLKVTVLM